MDGVTTVKPITIKIPLKMSSNKGNKKPKTKQNNVNMEGQIEIKKNCLKYFYGCWIKCVKKRTGEYSSGGFLTKIVFDTVHLRSLQSSELLEFSLTDYNFFAKQNSEQYIAMQNIEIEKEKISIDNAKLKHKAKVLNDNEKRINEKIKVFKNDKKRFEKVRDEFFNLVKNGKAKIFI